MAIAELINILTGLTIAGILPLTNPHIVRALAYCPNWPARINQLQTKYIM